MKRHCQTICFIPVQVASLAAVCLCDGDDNRCLERERERERMCHKEEERFFLFFFQLAVVRVERAPSSLL